jgi:hypothetical protein
MNAKFVMNNNQTYKSNPSDQSQDMLHINGELNSGMQQDSSVYYNRKQGNSLQQSYQPNHHQRVNSGYGQRQEYQQNVAISNANFNRAGYALENLEAVKDELRKKPFTVPIVRIDLGIENNLV